MIYDILFVYVVGFLLSVIVMSIIVINSDDSDIETDLYSALSMSTVLSLLSWFMLIVLVYFFIKENKYKLFK